MSHENAVFDVGEATGELAPFLAEEFDSTDLEAKLQSIDTGLSQSKKERSGSLNPLKEEVNALGAMFPPEELQSGTLSEWSERIADILQSENLDEAREAAIIAMALVNSANNSIEQ